MCSLVVLLSTLALTLSVSQSDQVYTEELFMKHLIDGRVMATFDFVTAWDESPFAFGRLGLNVGKDHGGVNRSTPNICTHIGGRNYVRYFI